jgi:hypothetical protein
MAMAIDLVSFEYRTGNPIILAEKIHQDLGIDYSIHQISDYLDINRIDDYEKQSKQIEYEFKNI